jgi:hypothetical protein
MAHIGGLPIEEAAGSLGPALLVAVGAVVARLRARAELSIRARPVPQRRHHPGRGAKNTPCARLPPGGFGYG